MKLTAGALATSLWLTIISATESPEATTTTTIFCAEPLIGSGHRASVVRVDSSAVEYALQCYAKDGRELPHCGILPERTMILTAGPSTMALTQSAEGYFTQTYDCKHNGVSSAKCDVRIVEPTRIQDNHLEIPNAKAYSSYLWNITITAGLEKLAAATGASQTLMSTAASTATQGGSSTAKPTATDKPGSASARAISLPLMGTILAFAMYVVGS
ncbi:hypothetical protein QQS21_007332 [Conoideocrella luteorostrata]|uniref:Uncharacterized protein n=1 Tax=Conoideocrella luteorostrata TaxID=1105319 RepID=A0AAJ0FX51_9HYPO|nr:hypothetical protein QQS21_007332 [Conoideocrella luteorostrata]